jgi:eukaryotic-like serine/threonine-protein kinase
VSSFYLGPWLVEAPLNRVCCNGQVVQLEPKIMQVLLCLAATPGELVKKEDLIHRVWADTFVGDDVLTRSISTLRKVFGDDPRQPRFIETIPKSGYRLVIPVVYPQEAPAAQISEKAVIAKGDTEIQAASDKNRRFRLAKLIASALFLALAVAIFLWYRLRPVHVLTDKDVIVLADFDNHTAEPVFDNILKTGLVIDLEQSPFLSVMPDLKMGEILKQMRRTPGDHITPEIGREICLRTSGKAVLTGSITSLGQHYVLQLKATNCQTGETLAAVQAEAQSREKVIQALGEAGGRLRSKLGESIFSIKENDKPLEEVTTSSLQALQAYSEGIRVFKQKGDAASIPFFYRALELDPNFASAYLVLGICYANLGETSLSIENVRRAYSLRNRLIEPERYFVTSWYYAQITGEYAKAIEQLQLLIQEYPRNERAYIPLASYNISLGQYDKAATAYRELLRRSPEHAIGYNLFFVDLILNREDEAQAVLNQGLARFPNNPLLHGLSYLQAFLKNDRTAMQEQLTWGTGKPGIENWLLYLESSTNIYYGRLRQGREFVRAAVAAELRNNAREAAAGEHALLAIVEAEFGHYDRACQLARTAVALSPGRDVRILAAAALASARDLTGAQKHIDDLNKEFPLDTLIQNYWLPAIRARIELHKGHPGRALELLQAVQPYELALTEPRMYAIYIRGQAHLAAGNAADAAADFQKILNHPALVGNSVTGPLAHLHLARARALEVRSLHGWASEDTRIKVRAAYQGFFTLWKDADPDIPILKQAKVEYAKLQ